MINAMINYFSFLHNNSFFFFFKISIMDSNEGIKRKRSSAISRNQQKSSISSPSSNTKKLF